MISDCAGAHTQFCRWNLTIMARSVKLSAAQH